MKLLHYVVSKKGDENNMFEYFRDIANEMNGIDMKAARLEREERLAQEKLSRFIFSKKIRRTVVVICCVSIFISISIIAVAVNTYRENYVGNENIFPVVIWNVLLIIISVIVGVSLLNGTKKGELIALVGSFIYVVLLYATIFLM